MDIINGFMVGLGLAAGLVAIFCLVWAAPRIIVVLLPKVLSKKTQANFMRDMRKDPWRNADVIVYCRKLGWHEEAE